jgi:FHS family glucose/mannose:H+ symporter-like MFS transporter
MWLLFWPKILDRKPLENAAHEEIRLLSMPHRGMTLVVLAACSLFFVVYVGFEMSFIHYLPSLLVNNNGLSDSTASLSLSIFWGAMVIGRIVSGHAADRWGGGAYMLVTCIAAAVFFVLMGGLESVWATFVLTFLAGLAMSGMFAIALVFANRAVPGMTERTTSLLMACGGIGGALMPRLTGWFLDENGADATRWLFAGMAVLMLAVIAWALLSARSLERLRAGTA